MTIWCHLEISLGTNLKDTILQYHPAHAKTSKSSWVTVSHLPFVKTLDGFLKIYEIPSHQLSPMETGNGNAYLYYPSKFLCHVWVNDWLQVSYLFCNGEVEILFRSGEEFLDSFKSGSILVSISIFRCHGQFCLQSRPGYRLGSVVSLALWGLYLGCPLR
jgi:hypothetical protein